MSSFVVVIVYLILFPSFFLSPFCIQGRDSYMNISSVLLKDSEYITFFPSFSFLNEIITYACAPKFCLWCSVSTDIEGIPFLGGGGLLDLLGGNAR